MDIAPYIADLLRQHDEVNVPSLGTFYKERKKGYYDSINQVFIPPSYGLSFKEDKDTTQLNNYISQQKNISANTSNYFIEKFSSQTRSQLMLSGEATIEPLGLLTKTKDGYIFIDALTFDNEGEFYGLQPVKELAIPVIAPENEKNTVIDSVDKEPQANLPVPTTELEAPEFHVEEAQPEVKTRTSTGKILLAAATFILVGILAYLVYPQAFERFRQETSVPERKVPGKQPEAVILPKTLADSVAEADTIYQDLAKQGFEVQKPRDTLEVSTEAMKAEPAGITFEIIGAAFARRNEAETYVNQLKARGIYARIVTNMPGSKVKVSLGTFNDEASARLALVRVKKELNKDAWIARVKPKKTNSQ